MIKQLSDDFRASFDIKSVVESADDPNTQKAAHGFGYNVHRFLY